MGKLKQTRAGLCKLFAKKGVNLNGIPEEQYYSSKSFFFPSNLK